MNLVDQLTNSLLCALDEYKNLGVENYVTISINFANIHLTSKYHNPLVVFALGSVMNFIFEANKIDEYITEENIKLFLNLGYHELMPKFSNYKIEYGILSFNTFGQSSRRYLKITPKVFHNLLKYFNKNMIAIDVLMHFATPKRIKNILSSDKNNLQYEIIKNAMYIIRVNNNQLIYDTEKLKDVVSYVNSDFYYNKIAVLLFPDELEIVMLNDAYYLCRMRFDVDVEHKYDITDVVYHICNKIINNVSNGNIAIRGKIGKISTAIKDFDNYWNMKLIKSKV